LIKKTVSAFLVVLLCFSFVCCSNEPTVYSHCELTIPLAESFSEIENENFDVTYTDRESVVAILRISFEAGLNSGISNLMSAYEFGEFWLERCEREASVVKGSTVYCEYYDGEQYYLEAFYRSKRAYFVVLFATAEENADKNRGKYLEYADGVIFS
jgi:hypothetical protein